MAFLEPADVILLTVRDLNVAAAWYQEKLDCWIVLVDSSEFSIVCEFEADQPSLVIGLPRPGDPGLESQDLVPVLYAKKVSKAHDVLSQRGVAVGPIQRDQGGTQFFEFRDPDGNRLEVCEEH